MLVARTQGEGREILAQLARRGCSWVGFEVTTPLLLARQVLDRAGLSEAERRIDEFDEQRLLEQALDAAVEGGETGGLGGLAGGAEPIQDDLPAFLPVTGGLGELVGKVGFRRAVRSAVKELRLAGISGSGCAKRSGASAQLQLVAAVLARFEALLEKGGQTDEAWALRRAAEALEDGTVDADGTLRGESPADWDCGAAYLLPGHADGGLRGRFLRALLRRGAVLLRTDPTAGFPVPARRRALWHAVQEAAPGSGLHAVDSLGRRAEHVEAYRAASMYDELRGVLRRALARGARWDEVEIVASDPMAYGSALHALVDSLGIPVTFAAGLPVERTRPGRVVAAYFRWIEERFAEPVFRSLLEAGDLRARGKGLDVLPRRLAEALRRLRIGYRRDRYMPAVLRAQANVQHMTPYRYESAERFEKRKERRARELSALEDVLGPVLEATPPEDGSRVSPADVAKGVRSLLDRVADGTDADAAALQELLRRLDRIEAELDRPNDFASAAAVVRGFLAVRVAPPLAGDQADPLSSGAVGSSALPLPAVGQAPWTSAPGHLHLSSLEHGGLSGRPFTFVVGMDSGSFPGPSYEDPLLSDGDRSRLGAAASSDGRLALRLAADEVQERRFLFAELFARLRGCVWVSYASWEPAQARELAPAAEVLHVFRLAAGDPGRSFSDLAEHLSEPESRVPGAPDLLLDPEDAWFHAIAEGDGSFRRALDAVGRAYPRLGDGMAVAKALSSRAPSVHAGMLGGRRRPFKFQDMSDRRLSAGALEHLGACPRRFLFRTALGIYPPDDPEFDPHRWLNPLKRGNLLHRVFKRTLCLARDRGVPPEDEAFLELALRQVDDESRRALAETPSPSEAVRQWEQEAMRADAKLFVDMIRDRRPAWREAELPFGDDGDGLEIDFGGRVVRMRGAIDRVDDVGEPEAGGSVAGELAAGGSVAEGSLTGGSVAAAGVPKPRSLRVVDYKTGRVHARWDKDHGVYDGGRRLQHVVYAAVAEALLGRPVEQVEYQFPTRRGGNEVRAYGAEEFEDGGRLVAALLDGAEAGWFPATDDPGDCRFCDYKPACGVREHDGGPCKPVEWTIARMQDDVPSGDDGLGSLRKVRAMRGKSQPAAKRAAAGLSGARAS